MKGIPSRRNLALALLAAFWSAPSFAWGPQGTALVGELAQRQLTAEAREEAVRLLGLVKQSEFAVVANWAGTLGQNPSTQDLWEQTKNERLVIYGGEDCQYQPPRDCQNGVCTVAAIERNRAILADSKAPNQARLMALLFLIHHVADAHSPLNNSYKADKGGYDYPVKIGGRTYTLRKTWDDFLLADAKLDVKAYADRLQRGLPAASALETPARWSEESCQIVRDGGIYPRVASTRKLPGRPRSDDENDIDYAAREQEYNRTGQTYSRGDKLMNQGSGDSGTVDARYFKAFVPVAEQRVGLASARLAGVLNQALVAGRPTP
ncbi:S1/P1 nuclease [Stutzerimonas stutzeri]|uniref:S1/P1 nuclease n=1 Tax=Stutzerimonas stutzeri TaxID=316 RepID=UPI0016399C3E|nr:S1/P1 nuclease [Stutzerimonas stutzeri]MDI9738397.1 S1/P1 nuclease [Stutzerimonas stutzeri]UUC83288.1 S1/P1 nuclease [Stutzerimonas stutzeri]